MLDSGSRKAAPQSCYVCPREVVSESGSKCFFYSYSPKLLFFTENVLQCCRSQSAFAKQRPQSGSTSNLFRPSYYPQWLPKSASQTCHDYRTSIQTWFVGQSCGSSKLLLPKGVPLCFSTNKCQMLFSKKP